MEVQQWLSTPEEAKNPVTLDSWGWMSLQPISGPEDSWRAASLQGVLEAPELGPNICEGMQQW